MKHLVLLFALTIAFHAGSDSSAAAEPQEFSFKTATSLTIFGDRYEHQGPGDGQALGTILLFHQGGGNARAEYATIAPVLASWGFEVMAFDLPAGGSALGGVNRTIQAMGGDDDIAFCDVYPDLEAALDYARRQVGGDIILWGSSYSGALVYQLAAKRGSDVQAVLGFSPASGGPMADCRPGNYLGDVHIPALAFRPASEMGRDSTDRQQARFEAAEIPFHIIENGVHGSSMLNQERALGDAGRAWEIVFEFLQKLQH